MQFTLGWDKDPIESVTDAIGVVHAGEEALNGQHLIAVIGKIFDIVITRAV
jgi:hypothetical protein